MDALPERRLIGAILGAAVQDAQTPTNMGIQAADFLLGPHSTKFLNLLDIDPDEYRKQLWLWANADSYGELGNVARDRRAMRINLEEASKRYGHKLR